MHDNDGNGLAHDLRALNALAERRRFLRLLAGATLLPVLGCGGSAEQARTGGMGGSGASGGSGGGSGAAGTGSTSGECSAIPDETAGPFPGDGTNGPNALVESAVVRSDIRSSFGSMSGVAGGVPLTVELTLVSASSACSLLAGHAIYLWQCDRDGNYSIYMQSSENYLRGVQATDGSGKAAFTSIFPGAYPGRWPHIHFEIFRNLSEATSGARALKTSQLALPEAACREAYTAPGYEASTVVLGQVSLATDGVFSDGAEAQIATVTGNAVDGFVAKLMVAVS
jgi:protocatechuate 3,4-dioxygenase beta subunit